MVSSGEESYTGSSSDDKLLAQDDTYNNEEESHASGTASSPRGSIAMILMSMAPNT
jgi:hypothetical protein